MFHHSSRTRVVLSLLAFMPLLLSFFIPCLNLCFLFFFMEGCELESSLLPSSLCISLLIVLLFVFHFSNVYFLYSLRQPKTEKREQHLEHESAPRISIIPEPPWLPPPTLTHPTPHEPSMMHASASPSLHCLASPSENTGTRPSLRRQLD